MIQYLTLPAFFELMQPRNHRGFHSKLFTNSHLQIQDVQQVRYLHKVDP
jgi:hypothetical protein